MSTSQRIDLRSDTVTTPTQAMREAMATATVGDDGWGDDPSVLALQREVAELLEKEDALFVPSGTMANQLAIAVSCGRGSFATCVREAHILVHEGAAAARHSGVQLMPLGGPEGYLASDLAALIEHESCGWPRTELVCLENTLGAAGGMVASYDTVCELSALAKQKRRLVHLDGARLWNAAIASGRPEADLASLADTVSVCFSKGLGAPAGSCLAGSRGVIERARTLRHSFGGTMRQAGILAAAASYALHHHRERLAVDHASARTLAEGLQGIPNTMVPAPQTNMVMIRTSAPQHDALRLTLELAARGIACSPNRPRELRLVTHLGIDQADIERTIDIVRDVLGAAARA